MIREIEKESFTDYEYFKYLTGNNLLLSQEVDNSNGFVLFLMNNLGLKPQLSFFVEHLTPISAPFIQIFYPNENLDYYSDLGNEKNIHLFSMESRLRKEMDGHTLSEFKADPTILAKIFLDFKSYSFVGDFDYSFKVKDFMNIFKEKFTNLNDMEEFFPFEFFDFLLLNAPNDNFFWSLTLSTPEANVFIFALKSYLLEFALNDWYKDNAKVRRLYAKMSLAFANMQDFTVEPKFNHRIIPNLLQTNTLDILCQESKIFFENTNPVYLNGLVKKISSVNLMISFIYYLKCNSNGASSVTNTISQCLSEGMSKLDNETVKKIIDFMNYPAKKDSAFFKETGEALLCTDKAYNAFEDMECFMYFIDHRMLGRLNHKKIKSYIKVMPKSWKDNHILALEKLLGEKGLAKKLNEHIQLSDSLFDFSPQIINFMMGRTSVADNLTIKFSNDLEKVFTEMISLEYISSAYEIDIKIKDGLPKISIDNEVLQSFKQRYLRQDSASALVYKVAHIYLNNMDYQRFYLLVNVLKKHVNTTAKVIDLWKSHLKKISVTDLLVNVKNKFFVKTMYIFSLEENMVFHNVKKQDAKNILKELSVYFTDKSIPLSWLPSTRLSWKEQSEIVPSILMTDYDKSLNKNIQHRLDVQDFKDMVINYFDSFLMNQESNDGIYTNSWRFNSLFVNQHLVSYSKNLPKLLKALEDRPEYYVLVAINSYPEVAGTMMNRVKFALKMKATEFFRMDIKNILKLDFGSNYNLSEEQFMFLKHNVKIDWEICFKGIVKLIKNVYWTAKNKEVDIHAKHIVNLIVNTFEQFKTIYSFEVGINQNNNVNYSYLLEPPFFNLLNDSSSFNYKNKNNINSSRQDNFITSLLRHMRYDMGNNEDVILSIVYTFVSNVMSGKVQIPNQNDDYLNKAVVEAFLNQDYLTKNYLIHWSEMESLISSLNRYYVDENNKELSKYNAISSFLKKTLLSSKSINNDLFNQQMFDDLKLEAFSEFKNDVLQKNIATIGQDNSNILKDECFKI